jgi:two-component sensor histidine kinase
MLRVAGQTRIRFYFAVTLFLYVLVAPLPGIPKQKVLVLHSYNIGYAWTDLIAMGMRSVFQEYVGDIEEIYEEYCDTKRYPLEVVYPQIKALLWEKYRKLPIDVVVTSDDNALDIVLGVRDEIFPRASIIFCGVNNYSSLRLRGEKRITGVAENLDITKTLDLIFRLHPAVSLIAVVSDSTETGHSNTGRLVQVMGPYEQKVPFQFFLDRTKEELQEELRALPSNAVVLNLSFWRDRNGKMLTYKESLSFLSENSPCPIYTLWDFMVQYGTVGGYVIDGRSQGKLAAELAIRVLQGEPADSIPVITEGPAYYCFDYQALKRWNIPLRALPNGSILINRPREDLYNYLLYFWAALLAIGVLVFLTIALAISRRKWKKAEAEVNRSLQEKELLMKEIHHRVKNNLQLVSSLLNLEKESMFDSRDAAYLEDCRNRVHSMALVHENLYGSEHLDRISLQSYCEDLFSNLELTYRLNERGITLQREIQNLEMDLEVAVPLGLLITELVSNAAQHGFPEGGGSIIVRYREAEQKGWMLLEVKDTGVGFPEDFDPDTSRGLGLQLVDSLVSQLNGTLQWLSGKGVTVQVTFPA